MAAPGTRAPEREDVNTELNTFDTRGELAEALAARIADLLSQAIASKGEALLAISGGATPGNFFRALSTKPLDWKHMTVTLVDERFVPPSSDRSNEHLVRSMLLKNEAAAARFVGLYRDEATVEDAAVAVAGDLATLTWPLDAVVLGMGGDGHTASFFPDADDLETLLAPSNPALVMSVHAKTAGEPRLTLPLARLIEAPFIALHIEGAEKKRVLDAALDPSSALPISAVFRAARAPIQIFWAP
ncbi:MAG TPA: 6-phosphogluconolactonase [Rhizobiaceae bacterium]|nr:6-phosphogluconolactonase [Rhizobiaceae bacterium]